MTYTKLTILLGIAQFGLLGSAAGGDDCLFQKLGRQDVRELIVGNTYTFDADWGTWAEYSLPGGASSARAWGDSWSQNVSAEYEFAQNGEWCSRYTGEADWANPDFEYCAFLYTDGNGNYFKRTTKDPRVPENVGQILAFEIKPGDEYGLRE